MKNLLSWLLLRLIDAYAVTLGPHFGGRCRFTPSCSHYARDAVQTHGPLKGSALAVRRLVKCGPWHAGGFDPVPVFVGAADSSRPECLFVFANNKPIEIKIDD